MSYPHAAQGHAEPPGLVALRARLERKRKDYSKAQAQFAETREAGILRC